MGWGQSGQDQVWRKKVKTCDNKFSSVTQSCLILCNLMDYSTPGFPVHHQLPDHTQTHVHCVGDAIQPSHPLSSPSPQQRSLQKSYVVLSHCSLICQSTELKSRILNADSPQTLSTRYDLAPGHRGQTCSINMVWMCVPTGFICQNPNAHGEVLRDGLFETCLCHELLVWLSW